MKMEPVTTLDQVLADLLGEGHKDSSGTFQLDPQEALRKLRQFQLAGAGSYCLPLVVSAVYLGTSQWVVVCRGPRVVVRWEGGQHPTKTQLECLFQYAFSNHHQGLRHLALGVAAALREQNEVSLQVGQWRGKVLLDSICWTRVSPSTGLQLEIQRTGWKARLGLEAPEPPNLENLRSRLKHSDLTWLWQDAAQKRPPFPAAPIQELYEHPHYPSPSGWRTPDTFQSPGDYTMRVNLGGLITGLEWLVDGLTFVDDPANLGFPGFFVAIQAPLRLDASYQALVRDETYVQVLEQVRDRLENLIQRRMRPDWSDRLWLDLMRALLVRWKLQGREELILKVHKRVLDWCLSRPEAAGSGFHSIFAQACQSLLPELDPPTASRAAGFLLQAMAEGQLEPPLWQESERLIDLAAGQNYEQRRHWMTCLGIRATGEQQLPADKELWFSFLPCGDDDLPMSLREADAALARRFAWRQVERDAEFWRDFVERAVLQLPPSYSETTLALEGLRNRAIRCLNSRGPR